MMPQPSLGTAIIDADRQASPVGAQHGPGDIGRLSADEFAGPAEVSGTCFEHCSPIRTRCPGPAAQMSSDRDGPRWMPVCRRAVS
jgi:hypothetical protein